MDVEKKILEIRTFANERDWEQFHSPKNLVMALAGEAGELLEIFQWLSEQQSKNLDKETTERTAQELADIFIYLLRLFDVLGIDPSTAVANKLAINAEKYPV